MISKKDLKYYDFSKIHEYFDYIIESHINGNFDQVKDLYNPMNEPQQHELVDYLGWDGYVGKYKLIVLLLLTNI